MRELLVRSSRLMWLALAAVAACAAARGQEPAAAPSAALAAYVHKPDSTFQWRVQRRYGDRSGEILELHLESQTWQGGLWQHPLLIVRPKRLADPRQPRLLGRGGRRPDEVATGT